MHLPLSQSAAQTKTTPKLDRLTVYHSDTGHTVVDTERSLRCGGKQAARVSESDKNTGMSGVLRPSNVVAGWVCIGGGGSFGITFVGALGTGASERPKVEWQRMQVLYTIVTSTRTPQVFLMRDRLSCPQRHQAQRAPH